MSEIIMATYTPISRRRRLGQFLLLLILLTAPGLPVGAEPGLATTAAAPGPPAPDAPLQLNWSTATENNTSSLAWGDVDGDGDLDLALGNGYQSSQLYRNEGGSLSAQPVWSAATGQTTSLAWGDIDGDGDLDLAIGNWGQPSRLYRNQGGSLTEQPVWSTATASYTTSLAWGDVDGDGDLDLAIGNIEQPSRLYRNQGGSLSAQPVWSTTTQDGTTSLAWGDVDGDGDLDLAIGNSGQPSRLYRNQGGSLTEQPVWSTATASYTTSLAWGDVDGDGDLDLALGNAYQPSRLYRNQGGSLSAQPVWSTDTQDNTTSLAWGDVDGDGDLDLAIGNDGQPSRLYRNDGGSLTTQPVWSTATNGRTWSLTWGDADSDGDLDLAIGNYGQPSQLYRNDSSSLSTEPVWSAATASDTTSLAWGDVDGDGDLDLALGNAYQPSRLYRNDSGSLSAQPVWSTTTEDYTSSLAWGDVDGDGDLDLAIGNHGQPSRLYRNEGGSLNTQPVWSTATDGHETSLAWGDIDGDGDLDLALGNFGQPSRLYRNEDGSLTEQPVWSTATADNTSSLAWGDVDGDGDLDLAIGNRGQPSQLYRNDGGSLSAQPVWSTTRQDVTRSLAWGDVDGDGDLDLAIGNEAQPSRLYRNDSGSLTTQPVWSAVTGQTTSLAWGDVDGDGDLDLAIGSQLYRNEGGSLTTQPVWSTTTQGGTTSLAWGDVDGDGDLDLAIGNSYQPSRLYRNNRVSRALPTPAPIIYLAQPEPASSSPLAASAHIFAGATMPFTYTLAHPQSLSVGQIVSQYSLDGGGHWRPARATAATVTTNLPTSPDGIAYTFTWDVLGSGVMGQSDNAVFRLIALPALTTRPNQAAGPFQYGATATTTLPFRLRGRQVRVMRDDRPVAGALVYRLPRDQDSGGVLLTDQAGQPLRTTTAGYLPGRAQLDLGDRLFAMLPLTTTASLTHYLTSAAPTSTGLALPEIGASGVQTLTVTADHPLLRFDLRVALEWDAQTDPVYLQQLEADLKKASRYLYDFTDGQVALGQVTVYQNADEWASADVVVHASNRVHPFAAQGGRVLTPTVDPQLPAIVYESGQVHIGATWNRYGSPGQNLGEDWPLVLAHELSHYLLFLDDTYLGLNSDGLLIPIDSCTGSAMGDLYDRPEQTEFIADDAHWQTNCALTLAQQTLHRDEWATIRQWYPALHTPATPNPGPSQMPLNLTTVTIQPPITPTATLTDPTFYLDYAQQRANSSEARAVLLRDDRYAIDLGSPTGGENRVLARGARAGDRLCIFDRPRQQYGCETLSFGDNRIALIYDPAWQPLMQLSPVTSTTLALEVRGVPPGLALQARLYSEYGAAGPAISLVAHDSRYQGTFQLPTPSLVGIIQLWAAQTTGPRREALVSYTIGGNPGYTHAGGGSARGGGGYARGAGAPLISPDGHMIFFGTDPTAFQAGQFYTVQDMAGLPALPDGKQAIGSSYRLVAAPGTPLIQGSISFQYQETDVLTERANEAELNIHFWDGAAWQTLPTIRDTRFNLASAPSRGPGIYALLAGVTTPEVTTFTPNRATAGVSTTLVISGSHFLAPTQVALLAATSTYTLPAQSLRPDTLTAVVPATLPADAYQVVVINGDGGRGVAPQPLALAEPDDGCFADRFTSGSGQWVRTGDWATVILPDGERAMTDSPQGSYAQATGGTQRLISSITSQPFHLDGCATPVLTFRHDYVLAESGTSVDVGRVEFSTDGENTWTILATYTGRHSIAQREGHTAVEGSTEWNDPHWESVQLALPSMTGTVQLRFSLDADHTYADKGWLIDQVLVIEGHTPSPAPNRMYLPIIVMASTALPTRSQEGTNVRQRGDIEPCQYTGIPCTQGWDK